MLSDSDFTEFSGRQTEKLCKIVHLWQKQPGKFSNIDEDLIMKAQNILINSFTAPVMYTARRASGLTFNTSRRVS